MDDGLDVGEFVDIPPPVIIVQVHHQAAQVPGHLLWTKAFERVMWIDPATSDDWIGNLKSLTTDGGSDGSRVSIDSRPKQGWRPQPDHDGP